EMVFLYENYGEFDNGSLAMMNHASDVWEHSLSLTPQIYHTRVVQMFHKADNLPLIKSFLISVQGFLIIKFNKLWTNNEAVNEAYNDILIEDYKSLCDSFDSFDRFDKFDNIGLAKRLEKHEPLEFQRIAAHLYKKTSSELTCLKGPAG
ncbi:23545_t:CDS:2, partial [Gigaspora rosea]